MSLLHRLDVSIVVLLALSDGFELHVIVHLFGYGDRVVEEADDSHRDLVDDASEPSALGCVLVLVVISGDVGVLKHLVHVDEDAESLPDVSRFHTFFGCSLLLILDGNKSQILELLQDVLDLPLGCMHEIHEGAVRYLEDVSG